jgi:hypothetical protein
MALPDSYTLKPNSVPAYFDAMLDAQPPERFSAMQYHINIVLPDTRDQAVYDAIFKSLRDHLG